MITALTLGDLPSLTVSQPLIDAQQEWSGASVFTMLRLNAGDGGFLRSSPFIDLLVNNVSNTSIGRDYIKIGSDEFWTRVSGALQFGDVDNAAPANPLVLRAQGVVAGTLDGPGGLWRFIDSPGTGAGGGGGFEFRYHPPTASGTAQDPEAVTFTIDGGNGNCIYHQLFECNVGAGTHRGINVGVNGTVGDMTIASDIMIDFSPTTSCVAAPDLAIRRGAAGVLEINNGASGGGTLTGVYYQWGGQARVTSDVSFLNTTTLGTVTGLSVNVSAGRTYSFEAELSWTDIAAGGVRAAIAGTCTATNIIYDGWIVDSAANGIKGNAQATALGGIVANAATVGAAGHLTIKGCITVNAAGTLLVQAAQSVLNNTTATVIKRGSTFMVYDMP
jgi:hypothetical protein